LYSILVNIIKLLNPGSLFFGYPYCSGYHAHVLIATYLQIGTAFRIVEHCIRENNLASLVQSFFWLLLITDQLDAEFSELHDITSLVQLFIPDYFIDQLRAYEHLCLTDFTSLFVA
jgi:hypothetical protein